MFFIMNERLKRTKGNPIGFLPIKPLAAPNAAGGAILPGHRFRGNPGVALFSNNRFSTSFGYSISPDHRRYTLVNDAIPPGHHHPIAVDAAMPPGYRNRGCFWVAISPSHRERKTMTDFPRKLHPRPGRFMMYLFKRHRFPVMVAPPLTFKTRRPLLSDGFRDTF